jgi:DNA invertase Pin-like site-specific DNA recombinase
MSAVASLSHLQNAAPTGELSSLETGDVALAGLEEFGAVERKTIPDMLNCLGRDRIRFIKELQRARYCGAFMVIIETLLPNGKRNPAAGIMLALLAEMARNESETLRERIKSGLALARKRGVLLGRRKGTTLTRDQFLQKHKDILRQLKTGQSVRNVAKIVGKGISTVQRVKAALAV